MEVQVDVEIDFEQLESDLRRLSPIQRQEVLAAETFANFPPKTRAKHAYLTEKLDAGPNVFSVLVGVFAALLGHDYAKARAGWVEFQRQATARASGTTTVASFVSSAHQWLHQRKIGHLSKMRRLCVD